MSSNSTTSGDSFWHTPSVFLSIFLGLALTGLNVFTIIIILISRKLRKPANLPVASFLFSAALQSLLAVPTYSIKQMSPTPGLQPYWMCDMFRFMYFVCGHAMKTSLLCVSYDRLIAIKLPYRYKDVVTRGRVLILLAITWMVVLIFDVIPFVPHTSELNRENCRYQPQRAWGLTVIFVFNILPFILITFNYIWIWKIAATMQFKDIRQQDSLRSNYGNSSVIEESSLNTSLSMQRYLLKLALYKNNSNNASNSSLNGDLTPRSLPDRLRFKNGGTPQLSPSPQNEEKSIKDCSSTLPFNKPALVRHLSKLSTSSRESNFSSKQTVFQDNDKSTDSQDDSRGKVHEEDNVRRKKESADSTCSRLHTDWNHEDSNDSNALVSKDVSRKKQKLTRLFSSLSESSSLPGSPRPRAHAWARSKTSLVRAAFDMKATKTSAMLLAVYLFCWGPLAVFYIIDHACSQCLSGSDLPERKTTRVVIKLLCLSSSLLAPIVYCWRTREFRKEVRRILCKKYHNKREFDSLSRSNGSKYVVTFGKDLPEVSASKSLLTLTRSNGNSD